MRIVKIIAATGVAMSEGVFLRESKRETPKEKAKADPKAKTEAKAEPKADAAAKTEPKAEAKTEPPPAKEEPAAAKEEPTAKTDAPAANADSGKCQAAITQMCNDFDNPDAKGLKKKDGQDDKAKTDACNNFDTACDKKKDNAGEGTLEPGKCAEKDKTASMKDAWQVADDFCNGSCGSC